MKMIVAGSRNYQFSIESSLDDILKVHEITEIVSGTARGVDQSGEEWARKKNIEIKQFPAQWNVHGRSAGMIRNSEMAKYADGLIAFWDGTSPGTKNMIDTMRKRSKLTIVYINGEIYDV